RFPKNRHADWLAGRCAAGTTVIRSAPPYRLTAFGTWDSDGGARDRLLVRRETGKMVGQDPMTNSPPVVLVVEDEADMRTFARIALAAHGYQAIEARTAAEGIRLAAKHRPDIVLLDLGLPDADGSEVMRRVREWSTVPI